MGLDLFAYSHLGEHTGTVDEDGYPADGAGNYLENGARFFLNPDFPGRADDIKGGAPYLHSGSKVHAGYGYGTYNRRRDQLAALAGYGPEGSAAETCWDYHDSGPFYELINFSDCEGVIGTAVSAKLAKDFGDFQHEADRHPDAAFRDFYTQMRGLFEHAAQGGAVCFG